MTNRTPVDARDARDAAEPGDEARGIHDPDRVQRHAAVVSVTTLVVSIANYAFSLVLIRLLAAPDYVAYASVQSLLLVLGSGGMAAIPWAVARHVALTRTTRAAGEALGFGLVASVVQEGSVREKRDPEFTTRASADMPPFYGEWISGP